MSSSTAKSYFLGSSLIQWLEENPPDLPWFFEKDPYKIWLSEIILQQTRTAQGRSYYLRFLEAFPSIYDLANAEEDLVLSLWQGLGYYSRARHLHHTAQTIVKNYNGRFPKCSKELQKLKGIGPYTAAAIASFAFGERIAVVDGNVYRVLARYYGVHLSISDGSAYKEYFVLAMRSLGNLDPASFNQAIMSFGATVCKPKNPLCSSCPIRNSCSAYAEGIQHLLPNKDKPKPRRKRHFHYMILTQDNHVLLKKRPLGDIWASLYDFPLLETSRAIANSRLDWKKGIDPSLWDYLNITSMSFVEKDKTLLSHQELYIKYFMLDCSSSFDVNSPCLWIPIENLSQLAFPQPLLKFVNKYLLY